MIKLLIRATVTFVLVFITLVVLATYNPSTIIQVLNSYLEVSYKVLATIGTSVLYVAFLLRSLAGL